MSKPFADVVWDPKKTQQLLCICLSKIFFIILDREGVLACCAKCTKQYRLQSIGGLRITNA